MCWLPQILLQRMPAEKRFFFIETVLFEMRETIEAS